MFYLDAPTFRSLPKDVEAEVGTTVTLSCDVDGYPTPEIRWLHHEEDQMIVSEVHKLLYTKLINFNFEQNGVIKLIYIF